jgi:HSP20 family protein
VIGWRFSDPGQNPLREMLEQIMAERRAGRDWMPVNVFEDGEAVVVEAAIPRVRPEDVSLSCSDNVLTIRGLAEIPPRDYFHQEMQSAQYQREIALPGDCRFEDAEASVENGVLTVRVPKARPRSPEKIRIQVNRKGA